jgi:hypothetical protein
MTSDAVPDDPRRLLAEMRDLAQRVRLAQRVTWLPLLALAVVTFGAIPIYRFTHPILSECRTLADGSTACKAWWLSAQIYWWTALLLAYLVIAVGSVRLARSRGLGARVRPFVIAGVALLVVSALFAGAWGLLNYPYFPEEPPAFVEFLFRLVDPTGAIGLVLLVLAWLERRVTLLVFALAYLVIVLVPINFGWGVGWGPQWSFAPQLVIDGGVLLLGAVGFALEQRVRRSL